MPVLGTNKSALLYPGAVQNLSRENIVVPNGLVALWGCDFYNISCPLLGDTPNTYAIDISGNGNTAIFGDGTLHMPTFNAQGVVGSALNYNVSSAQYLNCSGPTNKSLAGGPAISYCAWINATSFPNAYTSVMSKAEISLSVGTLLIKSTGKLAIYYSTVNATINYDGTGAFTLLAGKLYFLVMTYDSVTGLRAYVNAQLDNSVAPNGVGGAAQTLWVGGHPNIGGRYFNGMIDEPRLYNRALQPSEIMDLYQAGLDGRRYAKFNQRLEMPMLPGIAPSFISAWAAQSNLPVIGAGTY